MNAISIRRPISVFEESILATLCALADRGSKPTGTAAARQMGENSVTVHQAIARLQKRGWIERNPPVKGRANPIRVLVRPSGIERHYSYRATAGTSESRHPDDGAAMRKCLSCGDDFESEGFGNRRCKSCKASKVSDGSWMGGIEEGLA
jgi:hypothetical protein